MKTKNFTLPFLLIFVISLLGCTNQQIRSRSSIVDYLYPNGSDVKEQPSVPTLRLPLNVGIAFVPDQKITSQGRNAWTGFTGTVGSALTSVSKSELLEKVASGFRNLDYVNDIEVIPSVYLTASGGFSNLAQIQTMYGIDIIALVSYDQVQFTDSGALSLTYWTIVGAYVVSGEKNDTSTMLDTVVYDIKSKKMLFRAPGTSVIKGQATPINISKELRVDSIKGFNLAAEKMTTNLETQLEKFREKIKKNPEKVKIIQDKNYPKIGGGGKTSLYELILVLLIFGARRIFSNT
ncbi:MAG: rhombotarget lipoprotein [Thiohalomonadales bacterium]